MPYRNAKTAQSNTITLWQVAFCAACLSSPILALLATSAFYQKLDQESNVSKIELVFSLMATLLMAVTSIVMSGIALYVCLKKFCAAEDASTRLPDSDTSPPASPQSPPTPASSR